MKRILISTKHPEESRVVVTENGRLADFDHEVAGRENRKGDIYKGVVSRIEPSLEAAFVNFGDEKNGFLPFKDIPRVLVQNAPPENGEAPPAADPDAPAAPAPPPLKEGDSVLVQIGRDHVSEKGAALTMNISLAGCYLVLMPLQPGGRQITKQSDRRSRDEMMERLRELNPPRGMSVILRTAGLGRSAEELRWDLDYLLKLWKALAEAGEKQKGPILIYRENNILLRAIRDHHRPDVAEVVCDNAADHEEISAFMSLVFPDQAGRARLDEGEIIDDALEGQIEEIFAREVAAPSGARVVFDTTEALVAIDVNSAKMRRGDNIEETALRTNLAAAEIIARQLRLRDLGGLVVVDFIDMENEKNRAQVEQHFRSLLRKDRARVRTTEISRFGMMELSRQRLSQSVVDAHDRPCPLCAGSGVVRRDESFALTLLRRIRAQAGRGEGTAVLAQAPEAAAVHLLNEKRADLRRLEKEFGREIVVIPDSSMHPPECRIRLVRGSRPAALAEQSRPDKMADAREKIREKRRERPAATLDTVMPDARETRPSPSPRPQPAAAATKPPRKTPDATPEGGEASGFLGRLKRMLFGDAEKESERDGGKKHSPQKRRAGPPHSRDKQRGERGERGDRNERGERGGRGDENRDGKGRRGRRGRRGRGERPEQQSAGADKPERRERNNRASEPRNNDRQERKAEKPRRPRKERAETSPAESKPESEVATATAAAVSAVASPSVESDAASAASVAPVAKDSREDKQEAGMSAEFVPMPESAESESHSPPPSPPSSPSASPAPSAPSVSPVHEESDDSKTSNGMGVAKVAEVSGIAGDSESASPSAPSSPPPSPTSPAVSESESGLRQIETRE